MNESMGVCEVDSVLQLIEAITVNIELLLCDSHNIVLHIERLLKEQHKRSDVYFIINWTEYQWSTANLLLNCLLWVGPQNLSASEYDSELALIVFILSLCAFFFPCFSRFFKAI